MKKKNILTSGLLVFGILFFLCSIDYKDPINIVGNIEENYFILSVGIDKGIKNDENFRVSVLAEKFSSSSPGAASSETKMADVITTEGKTIFEAVRKFSLINRKSLFWGHIKYIVVSEDIAKENIIEVLDFFMRDHELRLNTSILVVKDLSAEALLRVGEVTEEFTPDLLDGVFHSVGKKSLSKEMTLLDLIKQINCQYSDLYLPLVKIIKREEDLIEGGSKESSGEKEESSSKESSEKKEESSSKESSEEKEESSSKERSGEKEESSSKESSSSKKEESSLESDSSKDGSSEVKESSEDKKVLDGDKKEKIYLDLDGFATFDGKKMLGIIEGSIARGLNWVVSDVESGTIIVKDKAQKNLTAEIMKAKSKIKITLEDYNPVATIDIEFNTNLNEIMGQKDIFHESDLNEIVQQQNDIVKKEAESVIKYAQKNGIDILNISDKIYHQHTIKWEENIKENWEDVFKTMKIFVNVKSKMNKTYRIRQPIETESEEK